MYPHLVREFNIYRLQFANNYSTNVYRILTDFREVLNWKEIS